MISKAILIDPSRKTVEAVEGDFNSLMAIYKMLGCQIIEACAHQRNGDCLYVDEEGLLQEPQASAFEFDDAVYHGKAMVVGTDEEGDTVSPKTTFGEIVGKVGWLGNIRTEPEMGFFSWEDAEV